MTDGELLELAANAAGIDVDEEDGSPFTRGVADNGQATCEDWNPLEDDGDALRLATKLKITIFQVNKSVIAELDQDFDYTVISKKEYCDDETRSAATRRAIVRAAAEIGKNI